MSEDKLQKRVPAPLKENLQHSLAFGVIAVMLYVVGFPVFAIIFLGVLSYFILKMFAPGSNNSTRRIFEFYLATNEIIRDDARRWYGFEIQEAIHRGEIISRSMPTAPPLVQFCLGALYRKIGDHSSAVKHLAFILEDTATEETSIVYPSPALRDYVKMLRKIERAPAESPLTSAAIRSLERIRKNKAAKLLEDSRAKLNDPAVKQFQPLSANAQSTKANNGIDRSESMQTASLRSVVERDETAEIIPINSITAPETRSIREKAESGSQRAEDVERESGQKTRLRENANSAPIPERKTISEVLRDIYDKNSQ